MLNVLVALKPLVVAVPWTGSDACQAPKLWH
jgi:hypothetical protein